VIRHHAITLAASCLLASCASDSGSATAAAGSGARPLSQRVHENHGYKQDSEGNWKPQSDRRSPFESQGSSPNFQGAYQKKDYQTATIDRKSWWGKSERPRDSYQGNTDASGLKTTSRLQGQGASEAGGAARLPGNYRTGTFATNSSRETGGKRHDRPSDAETDIRRRVFNPPSVVDWREQRKLSMEQSRGILGR
jgi:hypothetical protein